MAPRAKLKKMWWLAMLAVCLVVSAANQADARWFTVNDLNDAVDAEPGDGICSTDPGGAGPCTLRAAIMEANAWMDGDFDYIELVAGATYTLTIPGREEDGAAQGDLDITDTLLIYGNGATIRAATENVDGFVDIGIDRVFHVLGARLILENLTITGGFALRNYGGGIYIDAGQAELYSCVVTGNVTKDDAWGVYGGGIYNGGYLYMWGGEVSANLSEGLSGQPAAGGGIANIGNGIIGLDYVYISGNTARGSRATGGGIFSDPYGESPGSGYLYQCTLYSNLAVRTDCAGYSGGGGLYNNGQLDAQYCTLEGNAAENGGGAYNDYNGMLTFCLPTIIGNAAPEVRDEEGCENEYGWGGGIFNNGTVSLGGCMAAAMKGPSSPAPVGDKVGAAAVSCSVYGNTAANFGGGIFSGAGAVLISSCDISNNAAEEDGGLGGGIANWWGSYLSISDTTITYNAAPSGEGGGIHNGWGEYGGGSASLTRCTLNNNSAMYGGAACNADNTMSIDNSTIYGNTAGINGGGIDNWTEGALTLINTTVGGNRAESAGGGISTSTNATTILKNCTVAENVALWAAGGLYMEESPDFPLTKATLENTIVAWNTQDGQPPPFFIPSDCHGSLTSLGNILIGYRGPDCTISGGSNNQINVDPGLSGFQEGWGPGTGHYFLLGGSLAIDKGKDSTCVSQDQLGQGRQDGDGNGVVKCDVGSIEHQPPPVVVNQYVTFKIRTGTITYEQGNIDSCPDPATFGPFLGTYSFDARLTDKATSPSLGDQLSASLIKLTNGNVLKSQSNGTGRVGSIQFAPSEGGYEDKNLGPGEYVDMHFDVCIKKEQSFSILVNTWGVPESVFGLAPVPRPQAESAQTQTEIVRERPFTMHMAFPKAAF